MQQPPSNTPQTVVLYLALLMTSMPMGVAVAATPDGGYEQSAHGPKHVFTTRIRGASSPDASVNPAHRVEVQRVALITNTDPVDRILETLGRASGRGRYQKIQSLLQDIPPELTAEQLSAIAGAGTYRLRTIKLLKDHLPQTLSYEATLTIIGPATNRERYETIRLLAEHMPAELTADQMLTLIEPGAYRLRTIKLLEDHLSQSLSYEAALKIIAPTKNRERYETVRLLADHMPTALTSAHVDALAGLGVYHSRTIKLLGQYLAKATTSAGPSQNPAAGQVAAAPPTTRSPVAEVDGKNPTASAVHSTTTNAAAPSKPLSPPLQRLVGTWIANTRCDTSRYGNLQRQKLLLTVRKDANMPNGVSAEVHGIKGTAGVALDVAFDRNHRQYRFAYRGWLSADRRGRKKPYGLALAFLEGQPLLHGKITGRTDCQHVVAGKLADDDAPVNPDGLLYKVAVNRALDPLTEGECAGYARWLAAGDRYQLYGYAGILNTAVTDAPAMRAVLGHDLSQWDDEDSRKIAVIHRACYKRLSASIDPALLRLAQDKYIWRNIPAPLRYNKSKSPDTWSETYFALYRPLLADVLRTWWAINAGLLAQPPGTVAAAPQDENGLTGEWRGYYHCAAGNEVFMRLKFAGDDNPLEARFEFGPSLKSTYPMGSLSMTGSFDAASGQITLAPQDWIQQASGGIGPGAAASARPIGFAGKLAENGNVIEGKVKGNPDCPDFSVTKRHVTHKPPNPDGLLFHYLAKDMVTATVADCRNYAAWLVEGDELNLGGSYFFSRLRSSDSMREAYGKDLYQWTDDDSKKLRVLSRHCQALLQAHVDPEISELLARIDKKRLVWAPEPLTSPREGNTRSRWLRAEQLVMLNEQQQALAARKLGEADVMPPQVASIDRIDLMAKEATSRIRSPFDYLSKHERSAYVAGLSAARIKVALATARAAGEAWLTRPASYAALRQMETQHNELRKTLQSRQAPQGVDALNTVFGRETDKRADALWPDVLRATTENLHALAHADLTHFQDLRDDQNNQIYLVRFHRPNREDDYLARYKSAMALYRETVEHMVERSRPQLLAWINDLPPSLAANALLDDFSAAVFGTASVPQRYPDLEQAIAAKKNAYNPAGYIRPDILMSLTRGQWNEVVLVGLEDLAYITTSLREIKRICPGVVPEGPGPLMRFVLDLSQQSVARVMQGKTRNRREAGRAVFLFLNNIFNRPGCTVNQFGTVTGCTSYQDQAAAQEFIMTSADAQSDMRTMLGSGCGANGAEGYVQALIVYADSNRNLPKEPSPQDFWTWMAKNR